jgi:serine phosphatase RsbU (regulator of sigma subunit)/pSer/pThr/pTyr-binding forkhead associated (FHA) protein
MIRDDATDRSRSMSIDPSVTNHAEVTVFTPMIAPARYQLLAGSDPISIGRAAECTIPIKDRYLSRRHAEIVEARGGWLLKDCGSANGTWLNGERVERDRELRPGDRIRLGDTEIVFQSDAPTDRVVAIDDSRVMSTISIPISEIEALVEAADGRALERLQILNSLASELLEDRPLDRIFGFVVDRIMEHLHPSRAAICILDDAGAAFTNVEVRRADPSDARELKISRTLLTEVVGEKRALAFMDVSIDEKLSRAQSLIMQGINSIICAPLMINDRVVGVLYVDYLLTMRTISEEDVRLVAQIGRFAAIKLETTRLREESIQKRLIDEELKTAYLIQRRLLPAAPPEVPGYTFTGINRPCRTISGDYFDYAPRPDGRIYFVVADVSGKGITAGLLMAGLQASFRIFTRTDPSPAELTRMLNVSLKENMPQGKFITLFAGRLDPATGVVEFTNAGHTPPLRIAAGEVEELNDTDLLLGLFPKAEYRNQSLTLVPGDALVLFTDGVTEAENLAGEEYGARAIAKVLEPLHTRDAATIGENVENAVIAYTGDNLTDDLTLVVVSRNSA